jgi:hypothetical protein
VAHHAAHEALAVLRPYSIGLPGTVYEKITDLVAQMDTDLPTIQRLRGPDGERLMHRAKGALVRIIEGLATVASKIRLTGLAARLERTIAKLRGHQPADAATPRASRPDRRLQDLAHIERDLERRMASPGTSLNESARWRARYEQLHGQPAQADFLPDNGLISGAPPVPNLVDAHHLLLDRLHDRVAVLRDIDPHTGEMSNPWDPTADLLNGVAWAYQQRLVGTVPVGPDPGGPLPVAQLRQAALTVTAHRNASPLTLRRAMNVTAERADHLLQRLEEHLILGPYRPDAPRAVLAHPGEIDAMLARPVPQPAPRTPPTSPQPDRQAPQGRQSQAPDANGLAAWASNAAAMLQAGQEERVHAPSHDPHDRPATGRIRKDQRDAAEANALAASRSHTLTPSQS